MKKFYYSKVLIFAFVVSVAIEVVPPAHEFAKSYGLFVEHGILVAMALLRLVTYSRVVLKKSTINF